MITRRKVIGSLAGISLPGALHASGPTAKLIRTILPAGVPPGIAALIAGKLNADPASFNTDWVSTILIQALLGWGRRGVPGARDFAGAWLEHHLRRDTPTPYQGPPSRPFRAGGVVITTYCGQYSLAFPCYEMTTQFGDRRAQEACIGVAHVILHRSVRNRLGMVAHDDISPFYLPDACFFVVTPLVMASRLDPERGFPFREQAIFQLRAYTDTFFARDKGLVKTVLWSDHDRMGSTYWTRASAWLLLAMTMALRYLPADDPGAGSIRRDLCALADGVARVQDPTGGFHVLLDEPETPIETSGTTIFAMCLHEAIRKGWLPASYTPVVERAWTFAKSKITEDGKLHAVYTGYAIPAEERKLSLMDQVQPGWMQGFMVQAANELTTSERTRSGE